MSYRSVSQYRSFFIGCMCGQFWSSQHPCSEYPAQCSQPLACRYIYGVFLLRPAQCQ